MNRNHAFQVGYCFLYSLPPANEVWGKVIFSQKGLVIYASRKLNFREYVLYWYYSLYRKFFKFGLFRAFQLVLTLVYEKIYLLGRVQLHLNFSNIPMDGSDIQRFCSWKWVLAMCTLENCVYQGIRN